MELLLASDADTGLKRCMASVSLDRRGRSAGCGCIFHPLEVGTDSTGRYAPCGHDIDEWGAATVRESDVPRLMRPADVRRWQDVLARRVIQLDLATLRSAEAGFWERQRRGGAVNSRSAAAYLGLYYAMGEDEAAAFFIALLRRELQEREGQDAAA